MAFSFGPGGVAAPPTQEPGAAGGMTGPPGGGTDAAIHVGDLPGGPPNPPGGTPVGVAEPADSEPVGKSSVTARPYRASWLGDRRFVSL